MRITTVLLIALLVIGVASATSATAPKQAQDIGWPTADCTEYSIQASYQFNYHTCTAAFGEGICVDTNKCMPLYYLTDSFGLYYNSVTSRGSDAGLEFNSPVSGQSRFGWSGTAQADNWMLATITTPDNDQYEFEYEIDTWVTSRGDIIEPAGDVTEGSCEMKPVYCSANTWDTCPSECVVTGSDCFFNPTSCSCANPSTNPCTTGDYDTCVEQDICYWDWSGFGVPPRESRYYGSVNYGGGLRVASFTERTRSAAPVTFEYEYTGGPGVDRQTNPTMTSGTLDIVPYRTRGDDTETDGRRESHKASSYLRGGVLYNQVIKTIQGEPGRIINSFTTVDSTPANTGNLIDFDTNDLPAGVSISVQEWKAGAIKIERPGEPTNCCWLNSRSLNWADVGTNVDSASQCTYATVTADPLVRAWSEYAPQEVLDPTSATYVAGAQWDWTDQQCDLDVSEYSSTCPLNIDLSSGGSQCSCGEYLVDRSALNTDIECVDVGGGERILRNSFSDSGGRAGISRASLRGINFKTEIDSPTFNRVVERGYTAHEFLRQTFGSGYIRTSAATDYRDDDNIVLVNKDSVLGFASVGYSMIEPYVNQETIITQPDLSDASTITQVSTLENFDHRLGIFTRTITEDVLQNSALGVSTANYIVEVEETLRDTYGYTPNLVANSGFEDQEGSTLTGWQLVGNGGVAVSSDANTGRFSAVLTHSSGTTTLLRYPFVRLNTIRNPSFESAVEPWTLPGLDAYLYEYLRIEEGYDGLYAMIFDDIDGGLFQEVAVDQGGQYEFSAYFKETSANIPVTLIAREGSTVVGDFEIDVSGVTGSSYARRSFGVMLPANTDAVEILIAGYGIVDAVQFSPTSVQYYSEAFTKGSLNGAAASRHRIVCEDVLGASTSTSTGDSTAPIQSSVYQRHSTSISVSEATDICYLELGFTNTNGGTLFIDDVFVTTQQYTNVPLWGPEADNVRGTVSLSALAVNTGSGEDVLERTEIEVRDFYGIPHIYQQTSVIPTSSGDVRLTVTFDYDEAGNVISETLPSGLVKNYEYDYEGRLTKEWTSEDGSSSNPLIQNQYDDYGRMTHSTDETGTQTRLTYDSYGRLHKVLIGSDSTSNPSIEYTYFTPTTSEGCTPQDCTPKYKRTTYKISEGTYQDVISFTDGKERLLQKQEQVDANTYRVTVVENDIYGNILRRSYPFFAQTNGLYLADAHLHANFVGWEVQYVYEAGPEGRLIKKIYGENSHVINPGFEQAHGRDATYWEVYGSATGNGNSGFSTVDAYSGAQSMRFIKSDGSGYSGIIGDRFKATHLRAGEQYFIRFAARANSLSGDVTASPRCYDSGGSSISPWMGGSVVPTSSWQVFTVPITMNSNTDECELLFYLGPGDSGDIFIDDATLARGDGSEDGVIEMSYEVVDGLPATVVNDELGNQVRVTYNFNGDVMRLEEDFNAGSYDAITYFIYDAQGRMTEAYDALGRRAQRINYDAFEITSVNNIDSGTITYEVDDATQKIIQEANALITKNYNYDVTGRLIGATSQVN